tara:strand:- start:115 stop:1347 length:1233 start_codon:yes stop_codon:yes gene_type:complete
MANVPLNYKLSFYDPSVPTGVITIQENNTNAAVRLDTQFSMQDIIDTIDSNTSAVSTSAFSAGVGPRNADSSQALSETVKEGEVILIFPIAGINSLSEQYKNFDLFGIAGDGITGQGISISYPPVIINKTDYSLTDLFGNSGAAWQAIMSNNDGDPIGFWTQAGNTSSSGPFDLGSYSSQWMLRGLWEVTVSMDLAVFTGNLYDMATNEPAPMHVMLTMGGGQNDEDYLLTNDFEGASGEGTPTADMRQEESVVDYHTFTSDYAKRDITLQSGAAYEAKSDYFVKKFEKTFIRNNWSAPWWSLYLYAKGGAENPSIGFGTRTVYTGTYGAQRSNRLSDAFSGESDTIRINGCNFATAGFSAGLNRVIGVQYDLIYGDLDGPGWVMWKWLGATPKPPVYYYDGNGIGLSNL